MTAITYLEHVKSRRLLVQEAQREVVEARADNYSIRFASGPGGGSGMHKDLSNLYIRLEEREETAVRLLVTLRNEQAEAREKILALPDNIEKAVLLEHYISGLDWRTIARHAKTGLRNIYRIHREAISHFEELHHDFLANKDW